MNYDMSIDEYKKMISKPEFAMVQYDWVGYDEFEALVGYGDLANLFEELTDQYGRVPTQTEYVDAGEVRSKAYFTDPAKMKKGGRWLPILKDAKGKVLKWHHFKWDEKLQKAVRQRLARSYPSHMVEYSTILIIKNKYPEFRVGASDYLDGIMGVDVVIDSAKHNKVAYVHVTSASGYSDKWLKVKENRTGKAWDKQGNKHEYKRNFKKGHVHFAFSKDESESTEIINGIPMLKEDHIQTVLEVAFTLAPYMDTHQDMEQLVKLHNWLKDNDIDKNGLGCFWV